MQHDFLVFFVTFAMTVAYHAPEARKGADATVFPLFSALLPGGPPVVRPEYQAARPQQLAELVHAAGLNISELLHALMQDLRYPPTVPPASCSEGWRSHAACPRFAVAGVVVTKAWPT